MHMTEHMPRRLRSRVAGVKVHPQRRSAHSAALGGSLWEGHGIHGHHPLLPPSLLPPSFPFCSSLRASHGSISVRPLLTRPRALQPISMYADMFY